MSITVGLGYLLNRSCPAQRVALGRSDLAELKQPPGPMTFSYRSCSTYVNSPDRTIITPAAGPAQARGRTAATGRAVIGAREGRLVVLRDGSAVLIRQVRSTDAPLLADGFTRLSAASRRMRFLGVKKELSVAELRYFTDVDHHDHEALGALDRAGGHGVGIAR